MLNSFLDNKFIALSVGCEVRDYGDGAPGRKEFGIDASNFLDGWAYRCQVTEVNEKAYDVFVFKLQWVKDGLITLRSLREIAALSDLPIVLISDAIDLQGPLVWGIDEGKVVFYPIRQADLLKFYLPELEDDLLELKWRIEEAESYRRYLRAMGRRTRDYHLDPVIEGKS